jgi:hypothetical protein
MWGYRIAEGLWALLPVALVVLAIRPVSDRETKRFAALYGVPSSLMSAPLLIGSLRRNHAGRLAGSALGFTLPPVATLGGVALPGPDLLYGIVGYFLGAFVAALASSSAGTDARGALLVPRQRRDYLPRMACILPGAAVAASVVAVVIADIEPHRSHSAVSGTQAGLVVSLIASAATVAAIGMVIHRAQPASAPEDVTIDDALRTSTVHTLTSAGVSVALVGTVFCLLEMAGEAAPEWLHWAGLIASGLTLVGVFVAWGFRRSPWFVSRAATR